MTTTAESAVSVQPAPAPRVFYIDWLRILAVLLLFPFHTLRVFNDEAFYAKATPVTGWLNQALGFISVWHMPLLFFLAGCSTYFALGKRGAGRYAGERVKRLLVPLVFGILILIPPQTWYGARTNSGYVASFWHYLASGDFMRWNIKDSGDYFGGFGTGQLWFIMFLLIMSLVAIPLLVWAARRGRARWVERMGRGLGRPVWWIAAVIFLYAGILAPEIPGGPFVFYFFVFLLGFIAVCSPEFTRAAERWRIPALLVGVALSLFRVLSFSLLGPFADPSWQRGFLDVGRAAAAWLVIIGLVGFGKRYLDRTSAGQRYLAESSYPVYILHQTVIVIIGFYAVKLAVAHPAMWLLILIGSVIGTFALYEIVRRVGVLRFLSGMRPKRKASSLARAGAVAVRQVDMVVPGATAEPVSLEKNGERRP